MWLEWGNALLRNRKYPIRKPAQTGYGVSGE